MTQAEQNAAREEIDLPGITLSFEAGLATLTLNDPERLNAITPQMVDSMVKAFSEVAKPRRHVRCLLITGAGRGFCAGVNLMGLSNAVNSGKGAVPAMSEVETAYHPMLRRLHALPVPVVVAVRGPCIGIGLGIALAADHVVAADSAFFQVPFSKRASAPDSALTWLLPRAVGLQRARRMILRAERVAAADALAWGLIAQLAAEADFDEAVRAAAADFANGPTMTLVEMKRLIADGLTRDRDSSMEAEAQAVSRTSRSKDNAAAMRVFGKKEKPVFTGE